MARVRGALTQALLVTMALPATAAAESSVALPWTGTSSQAEASQSQFTVQRRRLEKEGHLITRLGFQYWSRGDLRTNPGVSAEVSWYLTEALALDLISATAYFSQLSSSAARLRRDFGLLPDSQRPLARVMSGGRLSLAYGKFLIEPLDAVVHLDLSVAVHLGALITADAVNFGFDGTLGLQVALHRSLLLWIEGGWIQSYERRTDSSFAGGPQATLGVALLW